MVLLSNLTIRLNRKLIPQMKANLNNRNMHLKMDSKCAKQEFEEIQIKVPWGHVSGKWWGPKDVRPILGMHGWQDNAGTFDTLAPLLPSHISLLSIDLPGHGLSSRLPDGIFYNSLDNITLIRMIMKEYNWEKISLIGHSMSSIIGFLFAALFPDKVDMFIGLDALKPHIRPIKSIPKRLSGRFDKFIVADIRNREKDEPPSYTYDECIEKLYLGTFKSISRDNCSYLLNRNIQKSSKYPDKYFFTRDSRLKYYNYATFSQELCLELARRITAPYLFIKATDSPYYEDQKYFDETIKVLEKNPEFEYHRAQGTHHVHLEDPTKVSGIINDFVNKYRKSDVQRSKL